MASPPAKDAIRLALIGCGFQGRFHAASIAASSGATLALCCDTDTEAARRIAGAYDAPAWSGDWEDALSDPNIDAVVVATPTHNHALLGVAAAEAGKHILMEKPMATTIEDCVRMEEAVSRAGVQMMIGYKFRFAPAVLAAKSAVPEPVVMSAHTLYDAAQVTSGWVNDRALSGGRLMSSLVHSVDLLRFLSGSEPVRVSAEGRPPDDEGGEPRTAVITIRFANGAIASVLHGTAAISPLMSTWSFQTAADGVNATIHDHGRRMLLRRDGVNEAEMVDPVDDPFATGLQPLMDTFVDGVLTGRSAGPGPADGTIAVRTCRAIEEAMATGQTKQLDRERPPA